MEGVQLGDADGLAVPFGFEEIDVAAKPKTAVDLFAPQLRTETGMAEIIVSHDLDVIAEATDWVAVMYCGRIVEFGRTSQCLAAPRHPYTRALIRSAPSIARPVISFIPGSPPGRAGEMTGCPFEPRCDVGRGRHACCMEKPPAVAGAAGWAACHCPLDDSLDSELLPGPTVSIAS